MNTRRQTIDKIALDKAIYEKYIIPTQRTRKPCVGTEFELPIVNLSGEAVDFDAVHEVTDEFVKRFSFNRLSRDEDGFIYAAQSSQNDDTLSYDCSYNTLELSFGTEYDINVIDRRFRRYYTYLQEAFGQFGHTLTGMGVNPNHAVNRCEPIHSGRYRMLLHHLKSYEQYGNAIPFHHNPDFGLFSCAAQVQLDVEEKSLPEVFNTFNRMEPLKSILFANSLWGSRSEWLCGRDQFWKNSLHGLNRHNVDMYQVAFTSSDDVLSYIKSMSLYCVERDGHYINFRPTHLEDYFSSDSIEGEYFSDGGYRHIQFAPHIEDLQYLRSFKFEDLTYRGTVEFRSVCTQPVRDLMSVAAFHTGLMEQLPNLTQRLNEDKCLYHKGYNPSELRELLNRREFPTFLNKGEISDLLTDVLDIAAEGLRGRNLGEESYLSPLYERAKTLISPARRMADGLEHGISREAFIRDYAEL